MKLIGINLGKARLVAQDGTDWSASLDRFCDGLGPLRAVTLMVHGYRYDPADPLHDPHRRILAPDPDLGRRRVVSWPRRLARDGAPALLAFGWPARGTIWHAAGQARRAGAALSQIIRRLASQGLRANLFAHSLGAAAALDAVSLSPPGTVDQAILMVPALSRGQARRSMATPAGRSCQVLSVVTRENLLFDVMAMATGIIPGAPLAQGFRQAPGNWTDLRIDDAATLRRLTHIGYPVEEPASRVCHWSPYLRPGLFPVYRDVLAGRLAPWDLRPPEPAHDKRINRFLGPPGPERQT